MVEPARGDTRDAHILDLDNVCLQRIASFLPAREVGRVMCVQKQWNEALRSRILWQKYAQQDWGLLEPLTVQGSKLESYRGAYAAWQKAFGRYLTQGNGQECVKRAAVMWHCVEVWFRRNIPEIARSLRPGASEGDLDRLERNLDIQLPLAFRIIYRFHDGQALRYDDRFDEGMARFDSGQEPPAGFLLEDDSAQHGLFGGYIFYEKKINTRLIPLHRIQTLTLRFRRFLPPDLHHRLLIIAASYNGHKMVALDVETGGIVNIAQGDFRPGCPAGATILDWMAEFARRLDSDSYRAMDFSLSSFPGSDDVSRGFSRGLSLFPESEACGMRQAVTEGVQIRVSAVYVPEASQQTNYLFTYSVRFSLLETEEQEKHWPATAGPFRPKLSVQLKTRKWVMLDDHGHAYDEVEGPGVIGKYPILTPGGKEFVYQSCNQSSLKHGSMEGYFTFVEGTIQRPTGPTFQAICPRFELLLPDYVY